MAWKHLGEQFDIHGGGIDLVFPHHENELAQTCCAFHKPRMANVWMHNGFLQVEGAKMSKSEGNFVTIRELLKTEKFGGRTWEGQELRLAMLKTHYRQPIDWTQQSLEEVSQALDSWKSRTEKVTPGKPSSVLLSALADDLNTPLAIAELYKLWRVKDDSSLAASLNLMGFNLNEYYSPLKKSLDSARKKSDELEQQGINIHEAIAARTAARVRKDFKESDRIRDVLAAIGVVLKDGKDPATGAPTTTWEIAR